MLATRALVIDQLTAEWAQLCASPAADAQVHNWFRSPCGLTDCRSLADLEQRARAADQPTGDMILSTLLAAGRDGDQLALRTVFQLVLGAVIRRAFTRTRLALASADEVGQQAATALWDVIATFPLQRRRNVAANLVLDTLHQLWATTTDDIDQRRETPTDDPAEPASRPEANPAIELLEVIAWGVDSGVITREDATVLIRVHCPPPGTTGGETVAVEMGLPWPTLRQRCSRATRKLAAAIHGAHQSEAALPA